VSVDTGQASLELPASTSAHLDARVNVGSVDISDWPVSASKNNVGASAVGDLGANSQGTITVRVQNAGESSAHDVVVVAPVPEHATYVPNSARVNGREFERDLLAAFDRVHARELAADTRLLFVVGPAGENEMVVRDCRPPPRDRVATGHLVVRVDGERRRAVRSRLHGS